jgi:branched-chain amino acid aminotransferase
VQPYDDRDGVIWLDGELVPWRRAKLHVLSHGLHYASTVFEGERVYDGRVFKLREHSERLVRSGRALGFELPYSAAEIESATEHVVAANEIADGYVRPIAWRGSEVISVPALGTSIHVAISAWDWPTFFSAEAREQGIRLTLSRWRRPSPLAAPVQAKAAGLYTISTMSIDEARARGFDEALLLDDRGFLAESSSANLFLVVDGRLHTPVPECFLDGITRQTVIGLARDEGLEVVERTIELGELGEASEVFLTGTAYEVQPVSAVDELRFTTGPITRRLMEALERLTRAPLPEPQAVGELASD